MKSKVFKIVGIILILIVIGALACVAGSGGIKNLLQMVGKPTSEKTTQVLSFSFGKEDAYDKFLNNCSKEFVAGKPVDENFIGWFHVRYGDEALDTIAQLALENKNMDAWHDTVGKTMQVLWTEYCKDTGQNDGSSDYVYYKECSSTDEIVLDFTGDIVLSEGNSTTEYYDAQENGINDCFSADLIDEMSGADIFMINNEFTYSTGGSALPGKAFVFRANPSRVEIIKQMGVDIVSMANNHAYDYGPDALVDTLETLEEAEIPYVGAGRNLKEAKKIVYFIANGRKIAIVSATQIERTYDYTREATADSPGVLKTLNPDKYVEVIREADKNSDYVIAFPHWGTEGTNQFEADQIALAKAFVEAGADVIIGGHTHCLQGFSYIEDVPVLYSLGNFWFSTNKLDTGMAQVRIDAEGKLNLYFLPCLQSGEDNKVTLLTEGSERERVLAFMRSISSGVTIDENGLVAKQVKKKKAN